MNEAEVVTKIIKERRSVRRFRRNPVPKEIIEDIVDCGRMAPSARNDQPWEFVVVTNQTTREEAAAAATYGKFIADAPVLIAAFARPTRWFVEDTCAAVENMLIAAKAYGLSTCWVAGQNAEYAREVSQILGAPDSVRLVALIAMGYSHHDPKPFKRPLEEVLHWERF